MRLCHKGSVQSVSQDNGVGDVKGRLASWAYLEFILPHHRFHWERGSIDVFGRRLLVVFGFHIALHVEIDELANRHPRIDADGLGDGNLESPVITKSDIPLAGCSMNVDTEPAYAGLSLQKGNVFMRFSIF